MSNSKNHEQCKSCENKEMSKVFKVTIIKSPCYLCLYNVNMQKTNNYKEKKILKFPQNNS